MAKCAALALFFCSASAAVVEEVVHPIREVSPDEFHQLALRQELEAKPKPTLDAKEQQKKEKEKERKQAKLKLAQEKEIENAEKIQHRHKAEEEQIVQDLAPKVEDQMAEKPKVTENLAKAGKSLACMEGTKNILSFYISQLQGGVTLPSTMNREKCMRAQLEQHCMPYESFPTTLIEPCDANDWVCANRRVLNDHSTCFSKTVDWEAVKNHAESSSKTMWEVLGSWCSHVKLLQEINRRIKLDEQFATDYPALLILEDHVLLDKEWTEEVVKDWVHNYDHQWDMVQLDTYGGHGHKKDKVREFRAKNVYKPSWAGQYNGAHAVLINTKSVPTLLERMQSQNVVPIEWLTKSLNTDPKGMEILSWDSGISTVAWEGSLALKQKMVPEVKACEAARTTKGY